MTFARAVGVHSLQDLELAFSHLRLPVSAREYLRDKIPGFQLLLTGLSRPSARYLRDASANQNAPGREVYPLFIAGDVRHSPGSALLSGRREQFERVRSDCRQDPELADLAQALSRLLDSPLLPAPLRLGASLLEFGIRTHLMGVVNVTPDSFSDGGQFLKPEAAIEHGLSLANAGADILDVGGESSRPGAAPVSVREELERVLPVIRALVRQSKVPISIDTMKSEVAHAALSEGATLVNDITAFRADPLMAKEVASANAACCLSHMQGTPATMQEKPQYEDVVEEVILNLQEAIDRAVESGVHRERILADPGIGFGKTAVHNLSLLRRLSDFRQLGCPILVGTSRKAFLGKLASREKPQDRLWATIGSIAAIAREGSVDIVRVHDVGQAKDALAVADAIRAAAG